MKRLVRERASIRANQAAGGQQKFTADDVVLLLSQINELSGSKISTSETPEGNIQFTIGNTAYQIIDDLPSNRVQPSRSL